MLVITDSRGLIDLWDQTRRECERVFREAQKGADRLDQIHALMSPLFQDMIRFPGPHSRASALELGHLLAEEARLVSSQMDLAANYTLLDDWAEELRLCLVGVFIPS